VQTQNGIASGLIISLLVAVLVGLLVGVVRPLMLRLLFKVTRLSNIGPQRAEGIICKPWVLWPFQGMRLHCSIKVVEAFGNSKMPFKAPYDGDTASIILTGRVHWLFAFRSEGASSVTFCLPSEANLSNPDGINGIQRPMNHTYEVEVQLSYAWFPVFVLSRRYLVGVFGADRYADRYLKIESL